MKSKNKKLLVTSALPYANGQIHIGHLVEYIQTDIFVRYQNLAGNTCHYICADDTHGTPIMLSAQNKGITPEELIEKMHNDHLRDFTAFGIDFDYYGSTNTEENRRLSEHIFLMAKDAGMIYEKTIEQLYDPSTEMFLPDRFVKGTCPHCQSPDQYGDSCETCSATYTPKDLINPVSAVSGESPILKESNHFFFKLSAFEDMLKKWLASDHIKSELRRKLMEWFDQGLKDWDISRDAPYFGFTIPGTTDKYFYVWLDAPVGYISSSILWGKMNNVDAEAIWKGSDYDIHHFIGKDIVYFHTLFWPAMLDVAGFQKPSRVHVHGFLTINGEKMSKSRGTFITAKHYLKHLHPEFLRYYYAAKLSSGIEDIDLNIDDFMNRINSDVLGKFINIASRLGSILYKKCDATMITPDDYGLELLHFIRDKKMIIAELYELTETNKAMREIMALADKINKYIDSNAPWELVRSDQQAAARVCSTGLNAMIYLATYLSPVMPTICQGVYSFLNLDMPLTWSQLDIVLDQHRINKYTHLAKRLEKNDVEKLLEKDDDS